MLTNANNRLQKQSKAKSQDQILKALLHL
uniref:Uncharacterized protein n=1 Tax=Anguilla anguilla TaxID=7936 RepID=A0A0E9WT08_ANGAN